MKKLIILFCCIFSVFASKAVTLNLDLHCLIQGYYSSNGQMTPAAYNQGCPWATPGMSDRILVQLRKGGAPYSIVGQAIASLPTSGHLLVNISNDKLTNGSYYLVIKNMRNGLETWSSAPVSFVSGIYTVYDFTTSANKAYGNNMVKVTDSETLQGYYCFYSGDVNQDGNIDLIDDLQMENAVLNFASGCVTTDLNGDGNVDLLDLAIFQSNPLGNFIGVKRPY